MSSFLLNRFINKSVSGLVRNPKKEKKKEPPLSLNAQQREYAMLSNIAYKTDSNKASSQFFRKNYLRNNNLMDKYEIDRDLSNDNHVVLKNKKGGKHVIAYRGSVTAEDWLNTDVHIMKGTEDQSKRFKESSEHLKKVQEKYGDDLLLTGHSLAGRLARNLGIENDLEVHSFNSGSGLGSVRKGLSHKLDNPHDTRKNKITEYQTVEGDIISKAGKLDLRKNDELVLVNASGINTHSLQNFL